MRWKYEDVVFEPAGKSHMSAMGAYTVSARISQELFCKQPPIVCGYDFVTIEGCMGRMSKTAGDIVTMEEALLLYGRDMVIWILAHPRPSRPVRISCDDGVKVLYEKYERFLKATDKDSLRFRFLLNITTEGDLPSFRCLCNEMMIWGKSDEELLESLGVNITEHALNKVASVRYYCEVKNKEKCFRITLLHKELVSYEQIELVKDFVLNLCEDTTINDIKQSFTSDQYNELSKGLNLLLFGREDGPPLRRILKAYSLNNIRERIYGELRS